MNTPLSCAPCSPRNADRRAFWCRIAALPWICWMRGTDSINHSDSQSISQPIRWEYEWKMQVSGMGLRTPSVHSTATSVTVKAPSFTTGQLEKVHVMCWSAGRGPKQQGAQRGGGFIFQATHHSTALWTAAATVRPQWVCDSCLFKSSYINFCSHHSWQMLLTGTQPNTGPCVRRSSLYLSCIFIYLSSIYQKCLLKCLCHEVRTISCVKNQATLIQSQEELHKTYCYHLTWFSQDSFTCLKNLRYVFTDNTFNCKCDISHNKYIHFVWKVKSYSTVLV